MYACMYVYYFMCTQRFLHLYLYTFIHVSKYSYNTYIYVHLHALNIYNNIFIYTCIHQHNFICVFIYAYLRFSTPEESVSTEKLARTNKGISLSLTQRFKKGLTKFTAELPKAVSVSIVAIASGVRVCMYLYINVYLCVYLCICVYIYLCMYMYVYV
jgi:hypothetical protein